MATALKSVPDAPASNAVAAFLEDPACVLKEDGLIDQLIEELARETAGLPADMATNKARDAVRTAATKINRMKKPVDNAKKALTEEFRKQTTAVNGRANLVLEKLQALEDAVRAPLTAWEEAEEARENQVAGVFEQLNAAGHVGFDETPEAIADRIPIIREIEIAEAVFGERCEEAERKRASVIEYLEQSRAKKIEDAERQAELERLKKEAEERAAAEAARAADERRKADEAEREKARAEAEAKRIAEAEERARREAAEAAERARKAEQARIEKEAREKVEAAEREAQRLRDEAAAKEREEARQKAEQAKREADQKHRAKITGEAAAAIVQCAGIATDQAEKIIAAIKAGDVPHVRIQF